MKRLNRRGRFLLLANPFVWAASLALIWEASSILIPRSKFFFGSPRLVIADLYLLATRESLYHHVAVTASEALVGLILGTVIGTSIGLTLWYVGRSASAARVFIAAIGSFPIFAIAPMMIIWFGVGFAMKAAMATLATLFVAISQAYRGAGSVSGEYLELLAGMNASRKQILMKLVLPGSLNAVLGGMRVNVGLSLLGSFIGEFISSEAGLGHLILRASSLYNTPRALAGAFCIVLVALSFDACGAFLEGNREILLQRIGVPRAVW